MGMIIKTTTPQSLCDSAIKMLVWNSGVQIQIRIWFESDLNPIYV